MRKCFRSIFFFKDLHQFANEFATTDSYCVIQQRNRTATETMTSVLFRIVKTQIRCYVLWDRSNSVDTNRLCNTLSSSISKKKPTVTWVVLAQRRIFSENIQWVDIAETFFFYHENSWFFFVFIRKSNRHKFSWIGYVFGGKAHHFVSTTSTCQSNYENDLTK